MALSIVQVLCPRSKESFVRVSPCIIYHNHTRKLVFATATHSILDVIGCLLVVLTFITAILVCVRCE